MPGIDKQGQHYCTRTAASHGCRSWCSLRSCPSTVKLCERLRGGQVTRACTMCRTGRSSNEIGSWSPLAMCGAQPGSSQVWCLCCCCAVAAFSQEHYVSNVSKEGMTPWALMTGLCCAQAGLQLCLMNPAVPWAFWPSVTSTYQYRRILLMPLATVWVGHAVFSRTRHVHA